MLFLLFFAIGLWLTEAIPPFAVGLFIMAFLVFALGNKNFNSTPEDIAKYVNSFSNSVIWLMLGGFPNEIFFIFVLAYVTMLFSNIMSNTTTSTVLIPLGMALLINLKTEVAPIIGLAASTALFLPVSTPPNAIAYSTGLLEQKNFKVGGTPIGLLGPELVIVWVVLNV